MVGVKWGAASALQQHLHKAHSPSGSPPSSAIPGGRTQVLRTPIKTGSGMHQVDPLSPVIKGTGPDVLKSVGGGGLTGCIIVHPDFIPLEFGDNLTYTYTIGIPILPLGFDVQTWYSYFWNLSFI